MSSLTEDKRLGGTMASWLSEFRKQRISIARELFKDVDLLIF